MGVLKWVRVQWDRAAALALTVVAVIAFVLGWIGVSGDAYVANQLPYIVSGALLAIFLVGIAAALWLSADLRDEWRELRAIRHQLGEQGALIAEAAAASRGQGVANAHAPERLTAGTQSVR
jgi:hypothetical protein